MDENDVYMAKNVNILNFSSSCNTFIKSIYKLRGGGIQYLAHALCFSALQLFYSYFALKLSVLTTKNTCCY